MTTLTRIPWAPVVSRRNRAIRPRAGSGGWTTDNGTLYPATVDSAFTTPAGRTSVRTDRAASSPSSIISSVSLIGCASATTAGRVPVTAGETFTGSIMSAASWAAHRVVVTLFWYNSAGTEITASRTTVTIDTTGAANAWQNIPFSTVVPASATTVAVSASHRLVSGTSVGTEKAWLGDAMFGDGGSYFDGATTNLPTASYLWDGTADASSSRMEIPSGTDQITPTSVKAPHKMTRESRTITHTLLEDSYPLYTRRAPGVGTGAFKLSFDTYATSYAALTFLSSPVTFFIESDMMTGVASASGAQGGMYFEVTGGELELTQHDDIASLWWLTVPFSENRMGA